jgi:Uma2 family endonuclease
MTYTLPKLFSFDEFLGQYGDDSRYELIDGELRDMEPTGLRPDVIVLDEAALAEEPLWAKQPVLTSGKAIRLVAEVVSTNWQDDYARKIEEYALLGISEYWIVDFRGLGGIAFIGKPKQPTLTVCQLVKGEYVQRQYRLGEMIASSLFPDLRLQLDNLMP